jgi:hypothetical protein
MTIHLKQPFQLSSPLNKMGRHQSAIWSVVCQLLLLVVTVRGQEDPQYFYFDSEYVLEYHSKGGVLQNNFMEEKGPKVVEFYSPHCVSK